MGKQKKKRNKSYQPKGPMAEINRISRIIDKISVDDTINKSISKLNEVNEKIANNNTIDTAKTLLYNQTIIKNITNPEHTIERYFVDNIDEVEVVDKPFVVGYARDYSGCGHFRMIYPMNMINSKYSQSGKINCILYPLPVTQDDIVKHVRCFVFLRLS